MQREPPLKEVWREEEVWREGKVWQDWEEVFKKIGNCLGSADGDLTSPHKPEHPRCAGLLSKCAWAHYPHYNSSAPQLYLTLPSSTVGMRPQPILCDQMG